MKKILNVVSFVLITVSGICFISGVMVLRGGE